MSEPLCRDCQDHGSQVKATRYVGKTPVCDFHMQERLGNKHTGTATAHLSRAAAPPTVSTSEEEKKMPSSGRLTEKEIEGIRAAAAAGKDFGEIAEEYGVVYSTVAYHAKKATKGKKVAGGGQNCAARKWQRARRSGRRSLLTRAFFGRPGRALVQPAPREESRAA
jgi:hypothetical protein